MMEPLNIAFFGSSLLSSYWNGAATYYRGIIQALHNLGHRITFYEPDAYGRQQNRDIDPPDYAEVHVYSGEGTDGVYRALDLARKADWIIKASGVGVHDELLEREIASLAGRYMVAFWDVDAPATLDRIEQNPSDPFRVLIPQFDLVFTYGGGDPVVNAYRQAGARDCVPIYNALDPSTHYPVEPDPRFFSDLSFLGNRLPDREMRVEEFFLKAAVVAPRHTFLLGGAGWETRTLPKNVSHLGHVGTREHNAFNCSARAVLNVSRESMARYGFSPATRVFEAAGAGACLITDAWEGVEYFFEPGEEILVAHSGEEVAHHVRSLKQDRARMIGEAALRRALNHHTYAQRAEKVQQVLAGRSIAVER